jgi:hypothetical protein
VKHPKSGRVILTFLKKGGTKSPNRRELSAFFLLAGNSPVVSSEIYKLRKSSKI